MLNTINLNCEYVVTKILKDHSFRVGDGVKDVLEIRGYRTPESKDFTTIRMPVDVFTNAVKQVSHYILKDYKKLEKQLVTMRDAAEDIVNE